MLNLCFHKRKYKEIESNQIVILPRHKMYFRLLCAFCKFPHPEVSHKYKIFSSHLVTK